MKKRPAEAGDGDMAMKLAVPPPPPKKTAATVSVTNREIAKFWRHKRMVEEDHLMAAIKAAARIKARNLTDDDYKRFEESLNADSDNEAEETASKKNKIEEKELRVGIKDWWTKSKYAYLNQPAIEATDKPKLKTSAYIPNFCNYNKPRLPPTASFGIF